jgi:prepilin-type N-terminal cleavage/methylation domain-containing protein
MPHARPIARRPHNAPIRARRAGFTLVEVSVVVLITGILAVTVIPALNLMSSAKRTAAAHEVQRRVELARARAMTGGRPMGLKVDVPTGTVQTMTIATAGAAPTVASGSDGTVEPAFSISSAFPGGTIVSYSGGDGASNSGTIWFAYDGTPQARQSNGTLIGACTSDATIQLTGSEFIYVRRGSGAVQR